MNSRPRPTCALSWSGGKDSALALWTLRRQQLEPEALITTVTEGYDRISMHGVRRELLARQADAVGITLVEIVIPPSCLNEVYEARMAQAFSAAPLAGVEAVGFGDLFLEDVRAYREGRLAAAGKRGLFPLWGRDTGELARPEVQCDPDAERLRRAHLPAVLRRRSPDAEHAPDTGSSQHRDPCSRPHRYRRSTTIEEETAMSTEASAERWEDESDPEEREEMSHDAIAQRAYQISLSAEAGSELDNWLQAEREMTVDAADDD